MGGVIAALPPKASSRAVSQPSRMLLTRSTLFCPRHSEPAVYGIETYQNKRGHPPPRVRKTTPANTRPAQHDLALPYGGRSIAMCHETSGLNTKRYESNNDPSKSHRMSGLDGGWQGPDRSTVFAVRPQFVLETACQPCPGSHAAARCCSACNLQFLSGGPALRAPKETDEADEL